VARGRARCAAAPRRCAAAAARGAFAPAAPAAAAALLSPPPPLLHRAAPRRRRGAAAATPAATAADVEAWCAHPFTPLHTHTLFFPRPPHSHPCRPPSPPLPRNAASEARRLDALEASLSSDLATTAAAFTAPVLTWAGLAGDTALLAALHRAKLLPAVRVVFIDTLHLFPETHELLKSCESKYGFKALRYAPAGADTKAEWNKRYASDLYMTDPERYDQARGGFSARLALFWGFLRGGSVLGESSSSSAQSWAQKRIAKTRALTVSCVRAASCVQLAKVEPLERALAELHVDAWINGAWGGGRRRHTAPTRAHMRMRVC
jgi:3'-phosphoadenosine 5'-phosphosulfate sulfotransferase (PAPS reductase)/FAD synthetase